MKRQLRIRLESWPTKQPFRISRHTWNEFPCLVCEVEEDGLVGRGEGMGVYYLGDTVESMAVQIESVKDDVVAGADRLQLMQLLPPGGARFALDSALWDLEAQQSGTSVWQAAGVRPDPVETVFTIGLEDEPETMGAKALAASDITLFKVKLGNDRPVERIAAIRNARPDSRLIVDVNEGWTPEELVEYVSPLQDLGVLMLEQPLPRGQDATLDNFQSSIPLCADESCQHLGELDAAVQRYQMLNIKLDKCGGLTHGLELASAARKRGLSLMVGCMGGTSLSMAPSHVLAQQCEFVDIDGPLLAREDRDGGLIYERGMVSLPRSRFWGT
ncbi:MAG TPA: dipeptide epimerase [Woeseiaceae bacterium]|nr:dipeptide epimerase [Woeseiaceae bacterium]